MPIVGKSQRHCAQDRHTGLAAFQSCRINIGGQRIAQLRIVAECFFFIGTHIPRVKQIVPAVYLNPGQEKAKMHAGFVVSYS